MEQKQISEKEFFSVIARELFNGVLQQKQMLIDSTNDFIESAVSPNVFWVDLKEIDFKDGQTRKLELGADQAKVYAGKANSSFKVAPPFQFLGIQ